MMENFRKYKKTSPLQTEVFIPSILLIIALTVFLFFSQDILQSFIHLKKSLVNFTSHFFLLFGFFHLFFISFSLYFSNFQKKDRRKSSNTTTQKKRMVFYCSMYCDGIGSFILVMLWTYLSHTRRLDQITSKYEKPAFSTCSFSYALSLDIYALLYLSYPNCFSSSVDEQQKWHQNTKWVSLSLSTKKNLNNFWKYR